MIIELPRKYEYIEGKTNPLYKKYDGWNKISYSQYSSFCSDEYKGGYIAKYFLGLEDSGNVFSDFGKFCGEYLNTTEQIQDSYLDESDLKVLNQVISEHPANSVFEYEVVIDLEPYGLEKTVLQGFTDRQYIQDGLTHVTDFKSGNFIEKEKYYGSEEYTQTDIYCLGLELLGHSIGQNTVTLMGRKGNKLDKTALHSNGKTNMGLRLDGLVGVIDREYNREKAEKSLRDIIKTAIQISDYYKVFNKYFKI